MGKETTKSMPLRRDKKHFEKYLNGVGIDIGAGDDPLFIPEGPVEVWDWDQGDANMMEGAPRDYYDFVFSSHCLEHMVNVERALTVWTSLLKRGGHLFVVIPDYKLYEKCQWPSKFNGDHKFTFSMDISRKDVNRSNHYNISENIVPILDSLKVLLVETGLEDLNYNYTLPYDIDQTSGIALSQLYFVGKKL